jgi:hypothetical protein
VHRVILGARQLLGHALAGPPPLLQEDQEIGHLLPVRPLVELSDDIAAGLAGGGQNPKETPPRRWPSASARRAASSRHLNREEPRLLGRVSGTSKLWRREAAKQTKAVIWLTGVMTALTPANVVLAVAVLAKA